VTSAAAPACCRADPAQIDWEYLVKRARKGSRRVLSLLFYALSLDLIVPDRAITALYERIADPSIDVG
jgi:hypothetical protein